MNKKIEKIEEVNNEIKQKKKILDRYIKISSNYKYIVEQKNNVNYYIDKLKGLNRVAFILKDIELTHNKYKLLYNYSNQLKENISDKKVNNDILNSLKDIDLADENIKLILTNVNRKSILTSIKMNLKRYRDEIELLNKRLKGLSSLNNTNEIITRIERNIKELNDISLLKLKEKKLSESIDIGKSYLLKLKDVKYSEDKYLELTKKTDKLKRLISIKTNYKENRDEINNLNAYIKENRQQSEIILLNYKELLLKEATCPLCFSDIDEVKANHIISQYE